MLRKGWGSVVLLQNVQRNAQQWSVGDAQDIPWLESRHSNEGKNLSAGRVDVLLNGGQVALGHPVDYVVSSRCRGAIASNQILTASN